MKFYDPFGGLGKRRDRGGFGVAALFDGTAVPQGLLSGLRKSNNRVNTQTEVGFPPVDADPLGPTLRQSPVWCAG